MRRYSRRSVVQHLAGLGLASAGLTLLAGCDRGRTAPASVASEPPPETTRLRLTQAGTCQAPQFMAEELLKAEGFTEVEYLRLPPATRGSNNLLSGEVDISTYTVGMLVNWIDAGHPIAVLAGVHSGCYELFGTDRIRTIRDLKGKTVAVPVAGGAHQIFLSSMAANIGVNPQKEIVWLTHPSAEAMQLLAEEKIDAYLGFTPEPQELRARKIGHPVVNTTTDKPWSEYFCCMVATSREFLRKHPVATKRALRAILKGADLCASDPERVARSLVERGFAARYDYTVEVLTELPYTKWRAYDPEDTLRYHTLRLQEAGLVKNGPKTILRQGTDWRFLTELKRELKG
jgi:NitT/TauT family transport system substrate-binding protein